ncbi:MAG: DUF5915 domain-containing protein, partial [Actinomycetota bacterium]|nr:DUF5915 domain-containing protein [Actinomycetota bacterium]
AEIEQTRRVVELGRQARSAAGIKVRQPLRQAYVRGAGLASRHAEEIRDELRVKKMGFDEGPVAGVTLKPNLRILGPRLGAKVAEVQDALRRGAYEELPDGSVRAAGELLGPDEVIRSERMSLDGWAVAEDDSFSVALDTGLDDGLRLEGRVYDLIRRVNEMRKEAGLELTDRIVLTLPSGQSDLLEYEERIKQEVLASEIRVDEGAVELQIIKA